ncbi:MAG TPA: hypothetical protein ENI66_00455 [Candidatus Yonathbacteria bacterium]|nr:hypothetical protein [Candidatus Yonathbacteria bacterium]
MKYKIKIVTGYRKDQEYSVSADEAHKAFYLFFNPEKRAIFGDGLAICGKDIQKIEPDYNGTMGWNPSHLLDDDDWNDIRAEGVDVELREVLSKGKEIAYNEPKKITQPLSQLT